MTDVRPWLLPGAQVVIATLGFVAPLVVHGMYVPDLVLVLSPLVFAGLFLAGTIRVIRNRTRVTTVALDLTLVLGTTLCALLLAATAALAIWLNAFFPSDVGDF